MWWEFPIPTFYFISSRPIPYRNHEIPPGGGLVQASTKNYTMGCAFCDSLGNSFPTTRGFATRGRKYSVPYPLPEGIRPL